MRVTIKAALISALVSAVVSGVGIWVNSCTMRKTNETSQEANRIAKSALAESKKTYSLYDDIYKLKEIPRLGVYPLGAEFYTPTNPEAEGQVKITIAAMIESHSEANAKDITINFETRDWYNHHTSLFQIYKDANLPIPHIASIAGGAKLLYPSYAPDAPSSGTSGYISQDKPFLLKLTLSWKDNNNKDYKYVSFYKLDYSELVGGVYLYFSRIEDYDSVIDGQKAFEYADKSLKEYRYKEPNPKREE